MYDKMHQGYPTSQCFKIRQKCLRWFSLCFRSLFGQFGVALKTIYLFGCLRGTLVLTKVLDGFFVSSESVSYPHLSGRKLEDMKQPCFRKLHGTLSLYPESLGENKKKNNRNIQILKCENTTSENRSQAIRKPPNILDEWNGYPEIFIFSQALEIST